MSDRSARRRAREEARRLADENLLQDEKEEEEDPEDPEDDDDDDIEEEVKGDNRDPEDDAGDDNDGGEGEQDDVETTENVEIKENGSFFAKTLLDLVQKKPSQDEPEDEGDDDDEDDASESASDASSSDGDDGDEEMDGLENSTVLTKRKTKEMKENEKLRREARKRKRARKAKREAREQGMEPPQAADVAFERQLRKIATKGVVMLFNTINTHQAKNRTSAVSDAAKDKTKRAADVKATSKDNFLDMLKASAGGRNAETEDADSQPEEATAGWSAMRDDFMLDAKLSDYGKARADEEELEDDEGAEIESVSD